MKTAIHYHKMTACVNYQAYQFDFPSHFSQTAYQILRQSIENEGENINPPELGVLHICHPLFFIQFPAYGFPYFKINFYVHVAGFEVQHYLRLFNNQLDYAYTQY